MKPDDLRKLHELADAKYKARQQIFQKVLQRENAIREDLARLADQAKLAVSLGDTEMKSIGADVRWQAWLEKARTSLNMKLALILAEKDQHIRQVRQAYGKVLASDELLQKMLSEQNQKARAADLERIIEISLFENHRRRS